MAQPEQLAYTVDEAAALVSVSRSTIENEIRRGALDCVRIGSKGGKRLITKVAIEEWLETLRT